ncbi:hypothetical protein D9619_012253 [Psilocybe cf. subviscida]|uniref:F-box domain-containing protein n=1 Tax=Psilocybe cf. subviscida TaxID=2480587 RepID=A0A8H5B7N3_9AGAR|nr:hypothetical protein D9619_012253 [Psilocybe cf. subviscida]
MVPSLYSNRTTEDRETYLQRSNPRSLDIWLTFVAEVPDDSILSVLDTLSIHSNRVRRLAVLFDGEAPKNLVVRQIVMGWNLERIESLELHVNPHDDNDESLEADFDTPGNFDQLKLLRSSAAFFDVQHPCLSQLTTLYLESSTTYVPRSESDIFARIISLPNLITLSVAEDTLGSQTRARTTTPLVAPILKHFRCGDTILAKLFLSEASFPELELLALRHINLKTMVYPHANRGDTPLQFLAPKLRTLALIDCRSNTLSSTLLASATSSAAHLVIDTVDDPYQSNVMEFIWVNPTTKTNFWPLLETFTYRTKRSFAETIYTSSYRSFSESRSNGDKQLKIYACHLGRPLYKRRSENFVRRAEQWEELVAAGIVENFPSDRDVVPWPIDSNFFSSNAEYLFTP